ncbi:HTH domain-containing protein, partial [Priestia aryabhattai]
GIYRYVGQESEPLDVDFSTLISKNSKMPAEQKLATSEVAASTSYVDESESTSTSSSKASTVDAIDLLLQSPKDRSKRVYRGFYFDDDVLSIIDRVPKSYKSELVNEALRKVFKEKGLLD